MERTPMAGGLTAGDFIPRRGAMLSTPGTGTRPVAATQAEEQPRIKRITRVLLPSNAALRKRRTSIGASGTHAYDSCYSWFLCLQRQQHRLQGVLLFATVRQVVTLS